MKQLSINILAAAICIAVTFNAATAQTNEFTYQGKLNVNGAPANGTYNFEFSLWDALSGGSQVGQTTPVSNVAVVDGVFTVSLDFVTGLAFNGQPRYLEIAVLGPGGATLTPRVKVSTVPYAMRSLNSNTATTATTATNANNLGGVAANQYVLTGDTRLSDARNPLPNSANYVQNTTSPQASSNFNISGTGTANIFNAATQYNIGGNRVLSIAGSNNIFAGVNAGMAITTGSSNAFFGTNAGKANTTGDSNTFVGDNASSNNTTGIENSSFGIVAGLFNSTGADNSFFGAAAGQSNTTGSNNSFLGAFSNVAANNLNFSTAIGSRAIVGASDTIVLGKIAGTYNGVARPADNVQIPGNLNVVGTASFSGTVSANIINATTQFNIGGNRILSSPTSNLFAGYSAGEANTQGINNAFFGRFAGSANTLGSLNSFVGDGSGMGNTGGEYNSFFGSLAGSTNTIGTSNTILGASANVGTNNLTNANAIGHRAFVTQSNSLILGSINTVNGANASTNVGIGTTAPSSRLHIADNSGQMLFGGGGCGAGFTGMGFASMLNCTNYSLLGNGTDTMVNAPSIGDILFRIGNSTKAVVDTSGNFGIGTTNPTFKLDVVGDVRFGGQVFVGSLVGGGTTHICGVAGGPLMACSSSLRYKTNFGRFRTGLSIIDQLKPITFDWKADGTPDFGLGAEDVAKVEPLLVTYNKNGQVEGVKYDRIGVVLVNAVKEQQAQIETQQKQIEQQRTEIDALKAHICSQSPAAALCKPGN